VKEALLPYPELRTIEDRFSIVTYEQKQAIKARDHYHCNFPGEHECKGRKEIHRILPQWYCNEMGIGPNFPENLITICESAHLMIHPDIEHVRHHWQPHSEEYQRIFKQRRELLDSRQIYWVDDWDRQLLVLAIRNTQEASEKGWCYPSPLYKEEYAY